jgi:hypothetical protein
MIAIRFAVLENLNYNEYINTVWESIKENKTTAKYSLGLYELV